MGTLNATKLAADLRADSYLLRGPGAYFSIFDSLRCNSLLVMG